MERIIRGNNTGKTYELMKLAIETNGIIACRDPQRAKEKAISYGFTGIKFISYKEISGYYYTNPLYIDELENFVSEISCPAFNGYTLTTED